MNADFVLIEELLNREKEIIRTVATYMDGKVVENIKYDLADTPCENVLKSKLCVYPEGVKDLP